jgi:hypothetical protein
MNKDNIFTKNRVTRAVLDDSLEAWFAKKTMVACGIPTVEMTSEVKPKIGDVWIGDAAKYGVGPEYSNSKNSTSSKNSAFRSLLWAIRWPIVVTYRFLTGKTLPQIFHNISRQGYANQTSEDTCLA